MTLLHWKPEYATGIDAVDHEHKDLIELINRLHASFAENGGSEQAELFFGDLLKLISSHFALEEKFMREHHYDQLSLHKEDHELLLDEIRDIMDSFIGGESRADSALSLRLQQWFTRHFETHDARLHRALGHHSS